MAILGDGRSGIFCADSTQANVRLGDKHETENKIKLYFDVLLTNPPLGTEDMQLREKKSSRNSI